MHRLRLIIFRLHRYLCLLGGEIVCGRRTGLCAADFASGCDAFDPSRGIKAGVEFAGADQFGICAFGGTDFWIAAGPGPAGVEILVELENHFLRGEFAIPLAGVCWTCEMRGVSVAIVDELAAGDVGRKACGIVGWADLRIDVVLEA